MTKRMLIDAAHPEETRVVVMNNNRLEEFDFEAASKKQLKGNIYLAKVTRVEPSLQAAFVEYGGNRHGFLAFSEIHPDYYRIPVSDRDDLSPADDDVIEGEAEIVDEVADDSSSVDTGSEDGSEHSKASTSDAMADEDVGQTEAQATSEGLEQSSVSTDAESGPTSSSDTGSEDDDEAPAPPTNTPEQLNGQDDGDDGEQLDTLGGDESDEPEQKERRQSFSRRYKIQEVIKRRQILLVQVAKEERGNKGAALTTYLSLAGRYCVLMPNTDRGGGVSRKITSANDRKRLKTILEDLEIPEGMTVIVRTAGSERSKAEIKRDYEYLMRLWEDIRQSTLQASAPALIHEEANIIKRSIRDLYTRDMNEVHVEGDEGYKTAKAFMKMLMPSHARRVQQYKDVVPLLHRNQVETQLDMMHNPTVTLRSGGYLVINQTEALVAIDVNSGRATRERHIEETALKTNLEAADEVGRQLRLRDLAGLIVIDFIDMEDHRHQGQVERRLKEALKNDRARIQVGRISPFGLMEMSRQRLRPSLIETVTQVCPHCKGTGRIRSIESTALYTLRVIEDEGIKGKTAEFIIHVGTQVALYVLNQKRDHLRAIEERYGIRVLVFGDDSLNPPEHRIERVRARGPEDGPMPLVIPQDAAVVEEIDDDATESEDEDQDDGRRRKRRRGRRGRRGDSDRAAQGASDTDDSSDGEEDSDAGNDASGGNGLDAQGDGETGEDGQKKRRRRGKRGGRRRSRRGQEDAAVSEESLAAQEDAQTGAQPEDISSTNDDDAPAHGVEASESSKAPTAASESAIDSEGASETGSDGEVTAEASAEEKPKAKRPRTRRKKAAPKTEEAAETTENGAAASSSETGEVESAEATDDSETKPKRRRAPRKKAAPKANGDAAATDASGNGSASSATKVSKTTDAPAAEASPAAPPAAGDE
ncbi:MAG: Rne/Rng family ribonuclease, partial [Pseudomonadota bacterium]